MIFYISLAVVVAICTELSIRLTSKAMRLFFLFFAAVIPSFFAAVRDGIGTDYHAYISIFEEARTSSESRIEWIYYYINFVVAKLGGEVEVVFFIGALLLFLFVYFSLSKRCEVLSPGIGMFVFMLMYYQMSLNATRQVIAMAIILYSIKFIEERKFLKFSILIIIASGFHNSALIFFPIYFLYETLFKTKKKFLRYTLYLSILVVILCLNSILVPILSGDDELKYYLKYLDDSNTGSNITFLIRHLPFIIIGMYLYRYNKIKDQRFSFYYSIYIISIILKFTSFVGAKYIDRISWNFEIVLVLLIPYFIRFLNKRGEVFISWFLICYIVVYWWYLYIFTGSHETYPYQWIFNK